MKSFTFRLQGDVFRGHPAPGATIIQYRFKLQKSFELIFTNAISPNYMAQCGKLLMTI